MQTLSVKLFSCKILKTKNCVPFEVKYYSSNISLLATLTGFLNNSHLHIDGANKLKM